MTRVEEYLTRRLRAKSLPLPPRGQEDRRGGKPVRILGGVLALAVAMAALQRAVRGHHA